jgi:molybdenum cofactor guanylyltransferase
MRTGIVLAGGRSARFGRDKLGVDVDGRAILARAVDAVAAVTDGVLVAVATLPEEFLAAAVPVALIHDRNPFAGPLAGLANVLGTAVDPDPVADLAIVVGGDMPRLVPEVLRAMLDRLDEDARIDAVLLGRPATELEAAGDRPSRRSVLPLALRLEPARRASAAAMAAGHRSLHSLVDRLSHVELPAAAWLALDPEGTTLLDVDTRADLERIRSR